ncbi:MAG: hypothetical protein QOF13_1922 [Solirubrobacterales bacterium]|nr:hypothetical protein [Solirubrobacterales bacterium]
MIGLASRPGTAVLSTWVDAAADPLADRLLQRRTLLLESSQPARVVGHELDGFLGIRCIGGTRGEQELHDQHIAPGAVKLPVAAMYADRLKAAALDEADTREVVGKDLADHLVKAALLGRIDERLGQRRADPCTRARVAT